MTEGLVVLPLSGFYPFLSDDTFNPPCYFNEVLIVCPTSSPLPSLFRVQLCLASERSAAEAAWALPELGQRLSPSHRPGTRAALPVAY